jgi:large subunit ribosomal protein L22
MMQYARALTRFVRISPRKARLAAGLIRGRSVEDALLQLRFSRLKGGRLLLKTLDSAIANAETQLEARREHLKVHEVLIDGGPSFKRSKSKSRGGQMPFLKRTSHFTVVLSTQEEKK